MFQLDGNKLLVISSEESHSKIDEQLRLLRLADVKLYVSNVVIVSSKEPVTLDSTKLKPVARDDSISRSFAILEPDEFEGGRHAWQAEKGINILSDQTLVWTSEADSSVFIDGFKFANGPLKETLELLQNQSSRICESNTNWARVSF